MRSYEAVIERINAALKDAELEEYNLDYLLDILPDHFSSVNLEGYDTGVNTEMSYGWKNETWNQVAEARAIMSAIGLASSITDNEFFINSGSIEDVFYKVIGEVFQKGYDEGVRDCF
jgi:pyruvoyl-dependent arginine decarboxylase (PvlArgDC)